MCEPHRCHIADCAACLFSAGDAAYAVCVHEFVQKLVVDWKDVFVGTEVVNTHSKCGRLSSAVRMFEAMVSVRNVLTWTAMVGDWPCMGLGRRRWSCWRR